MSFVDDVRQTYNVREFCESIKAVVRDTRPTATALRDAELVTAAVNELEKFSATASSKKRHTDVISAYLEVSPTAAELFSTLFVSDQFTTLTLAGLDCLIAIAGYAHPSKSPIISVLSARAVVKDIVKARAAALYDVFANGRPRCCRKALQLLSDVATVHPLLAKEIINRFDLSSMHFAPKLCKHENQACRIPFLKLIDTLLFTRDFDILRYMSTKGRSVVVSCFQLLAQRTKYELEFDENEELRKTNIVVPSNVQKRELNVIIHFLRTFKDSYGFHTDYDSIMSPDPEEEEKKRKEKELEEKRQKEREKKRKEFMRRQRRRLRKEGKLIGNFMSLGQDANSLNSGDAKTGFGTAINTGAQVEVKVPPAIVRRALIVPPLLTALLTVGGAPCPPASSVPRQASKDHELMRKTAAKLLVAIAGDEDIPADLIASAIRRTRSSRERTQLLLRIVRLHPRVASHFLACTSSIISQKPSLTSEWLADVAVIGTALSYTRTAVAELNESRIIELALKHDSSFIRHIGATLLLSAIRHVERDDIARRTPQHFLPPIKDIQNYARSVKPGNLIAHKILAAYQRLFVPDDDTDDAQRDAVHAALVASKSDFIAAQDVIRFELDVAPRDALAKITGRKYLSAIIIQAGHTTNVSQSQQLWNLAAYAVKKADLFPQGTSHDVDILFVVLSSYRGEKLEICARLFEDILHKAISLPYGLFDELYAVNSDSLNCAPEASLLIAACMIRLRKLCSASKTTNDSSEKTSTTVQSKYSDMIVEHEFLKNVLLANVACEEVVNGYASKSSYLVRALPAVLNVDELWWSPSENLDLIDSMPTRLLACDYTEKLLNRSMLYPSQPYLDAARIACQYRRALRMKFDHHPNGDIDGEDRQDGDGIIAHLGSMWMAMQVWRRTRSEYDPNTDPGVVLFNGAPMEKLVDPNERIGLVLETFGLHPSRNYSAHEEVALLRKTLSHEDFTVAISVILRATRSSMAWLAAFRALAHDILGEAQNESDSWQACPLASFRRDSFATALRHGKILDPAGIDCVIDIACSPIKYAISPDSIDNQEWVSSQYLYRLTLLNTLVFHKQHSITTRARALLSVKPIQEPRSFSPFKPDSVHLLVPLIPYFPSLRQIVFREFMLLTSDSNNETLLSFVFPIMSVFLRGFDVNEKNKADTDRECISRRLILTSVIISNDMNSEHKHCNFVADKTVQDSICEIGALANIKSLDIASFFVKHYDNFRASFEKGVPALLFWLYSVERRRRDENVRKWLIGSFSTDNFFTAISNLTMFITTCDFHPKNELLAVVTSLFRMFLLRLSEIVDDWSEFADSSLGKTVLSAGGTIISTVIKWTCEGVKSSIDDDESLIYPTKGCVFDALFRCIVPLVDIGVVGGIEDAASLLNSLGSKKWWFIKLRLRYMGLKVGRTATSEQLDTKDDIISEEEELVTTFCDVILSCLHVVNNPVRKNGYTNVKLNDENRQMLENSLVYARRVLTLAVDFHARCNAYEVRVKQCVRVIDTFLRSGNQVNVRRLPARGLLRLDPVSVLASFDRNVLESARENVFHWEEFDLFGDNTHHNDENTGASALLWSHTTTNSLNVEGDHEGQRGRRGTDCEFVLRTFLAACTEGLATPEAPVLDIGKVAKDGVLSVALTALSASSRRARALGYACVQLFSDLVGPVSGVPPAHASGLYRDRKQLAFVLALLKNSVAHSTSSSSPNDQDLPRILPLCNAWLIASLRVALQPVHDANKIVTSLLLRSSCVNLTSDCTGLFHLLNCSGVAREVRAARTLALDILHRGLRGRADVLVARRRMCFDAVFMLARPANGVDDDDVHAPTVRYRALSMLDAIVRREQTLGLVHELCQSHGLVPWLCFDAANNNDGGSSGVDEALRRLSILQRVIETHDPPQVTVLSNATHDAFAIISTQAWQSSQNDHDRRRTLDAIVRCARVVVKHINAHTRPFDLELAQWYRCVHATNEDIEPDRDESESVFYKYENACLISRMHNVSGIQTDVICGTLHARVQAVETWLLQGDRTSDGTNKNGNFSWVEVLVMDCFVARCLTRRLDVYDKIASSDQNQIDDIPDNDIVLSGDHHSDIVAICPLLARVLMTRPSVWTLLAALSVLVLHARTSGTQKSKEESIMHSVADIADRVPASVPDEVSEVLTRQYDDVVMQTRLVIVNALLDLSSKSSS